jgi:hypothetical protein
MDTRMTTRFAPTAVAPVVTLTAVAPDNQTAAVSRPVRLGRLRGTRRSTARAAAPTRLLPPRTYVCEPGPRPTLAPAAVDITAHGGPAAGCTSKVEFAVISAVGCWEHVNQPEQIPGPERPALDEAVRAYNADPGLREAVMAFCDFSQSMRECRGSGKRRTITLGEVDAVIAASDVYISRQTVRINGTDFEPRAGAAIVLFPQIGRVVSSNAFVHTGFLPVRTGAVNLNVATRGLSLDTKAVIGSFDARRDLPSIGGLRFNGQMEIAFARAPYRTEAVAHLALPNVFSASPGKGDPITGQVTLTADNERSLHLSGAEVRVPSAFLGVLEIRDLRLSFNEELRGRRDVWEGSGTVLLGPTGIELRMAPPPDEFGVGFADGGLTHAGGEVNFGGSAPQLFPGVTLQRIRFAIGTKPTVLKGGITLGVGKVVEVDGDVFVALASPDEPYTLRQAPRALDRFRGRTFTGTTIGAGGTVSLNVPVLGKIPFAGGYFLFAAGDNPYIAAGGGVNFDVLGIFSVSGRVDGEFGLGNGRFNVSAHASACIKDLPIKGDLCLGVAGLVSSEGIVICGDIGPFEPGAGYRWGGSVELFIWDCDMAPYAAKVARAAQSGDRTFTLRAGLPSAMLRLRGDGGPPRVSVRAPDGAVYTMPEKGWDPANKRFASIRQTTTNTTWVGINDPVPGTYTVTPLPGSAPVVSAATSEALPKPAISAQVAGDGSTGGARAAATGGTHTLRYSVGARPGQRVTFVERGGDTFKEIGSVSGGRGVLRFTPADGLGGIRTIEARITIDGLPTRNLIIARYRAPGPLEAGRPDAVRIIRKANALRLSWGAAANVDHWTVLVSQLDGTRRVRVLPAGRRSLRVSGVARDQSGVVTVRGVTSRGAVGPPVAARFRATARTPTRFDRYRRGPGPLPRGRSVRDVPDAGSIG